MKKVFIVILLLTIFASTYFINTKKAEAALPLVAPIAGAVGVYGVGMTMAILLTAENQKSVLENFQTTLPQAKEDWKNFSDSAKETFVNAYNSYLETGGKVFSLTPSILQAMQNSYITSYPDLSGVSTVSSLAGITFYRLYPDKVSFENTEKFYLYDASGVEYPFNGGSFSLNWSHVGSNTRTQITLKSLSNTRNYFWFDGLYEYDFSDIKTLNQMIAFFNRLASQSGNFDKVITNVSTISLAGAENNTLTNKDYWDTQIDKILQKDNTGSYTMPIPDTYAYPPMTGSPDVPDKTTELIWNPQTGEWTLPDGTPFEGTPVIETAPPSTVTLEDGSTVVTVPQTNADGSVSNVDVSTGEVVSTTPATGTGEGAGTDAGIWDWLKALLQKILDAITGLASAIASAIASIFIPSADFWSTAVTEINALIMAKLPLVAQLNEFFGTVKDTVVHSTIPEFLIDIPQDWGGGTYPIIDFSYFSQYRTWVLNFIRFTAWFLFLKRLYNRIPKIIY